MLLVEDLMDIALEMFVVEVKAVHNNGCGGTLLEFEEGVIGRSCKGGLGILFFLGITVR